MDTLAKAVASTKETASTDQSSADIGTLALLGLSCRRHCNDHCTDLCLHHRN